MERRKASFLLEKFRIESPTATALQSIQNTPSSYGHPSPPPSSTSQAVNDVKAEAKGLIGALTDFSFSTLVTPKILKLFYALMLIAVTLFALKFLLLCLVFPSASSVITGIIGAPVILALGFVGARVWVELIMVAFKILETLKNIESKQK